MVPCGTLGACATLRMARGLAHVGATSQDWSLPRIHSRVVASDVLGWRACSWSLGATHPHSGLGTPVAYRSSELHRSDPITGLETVGFAGLCRGGNGWNPVPLHATPSRGNVVHGRTSDPAESVLTPACSGWMPCSMAGIMRLDMHAVSTFADGGAS